jgi:hypothetical protein
LAFPVPPVVRASGHRPTRPAGVFICLLAGGEVGCRLRRQPSTTAQASRELLQLVAAGEISLDIDPVPLAKVEQAWLEAGSDRRIVFVP